MKTIHKLVLKAYLGPMILTFFIVMFVLMMNFVWRYIDELVGKGLSAGIVIELMTYAMANMLPLGLPLAVLLAAIMTMGNLGENYELLAMKSAGMSLVRITRPLLILVSLIAIASFSSATTWCPTPTRRCTASSTTSASSGRRSNSRTGSSSTASTTCRSAWRTRTPEQGCCTTC